MITSLNELDAINAKKIDAYQALNKVYESIIKLQSDMIDKLEKRLLKPKSMFEKFMDIIKTAAAVIVGISIGTVL